MNYLKHRFGFEKVVLKENEKVLLKEQLRKADENRLELFAVVALISTFTFLFIDSFSKNALTRTYYLIFDGTFCICSLVLLISSHVKKTKSRLINQIREVAFEAFPPFSFLWATAICVLQPNSMLNFITFYFVLYLFAFAVFTPIIIFIGYYFLIFAEYITISLLLKEPVFSQTMLMLALGCVFVLPFYYSFRTVRINSQAALIKMKKMNEYLENEVKIRTKELQHINNTMAEEINQRKIIESKLRETLIQVESSNQLKSEFLANISHEIRTPLNAIIGFTDILINESTTPEQKKEFQNLITSNTMYLLSAMDDIFDASLIKTNQITPIVKSFNVNLFLENIYYETNNIILKYNKNKIRFIKSPLANDNVIIITDEFFLKKAMIRMIDNAYKFCEKGEIVVGAVINDNRLEFFVSDTGIGIPEKNQIKIFEPFVQGDGSFTRGYGGSGLGLTIVKGIVRALGGRFSFSSTVGEGSKFIISFSNYYYQ